jgi:virulence factor Mce-like protein
MSRQPEELRGLKALMYRLEPTPGRQSPRHHRNGALVLLVCGVFVSLAMVFGYYRDLPFLAGGRTVKAEFANITNLRVGNPVRVHGVKVGKVTGIAQTPDRRAAMVSMKLDGSPHVDLREDATATIYWRTLLGRNMYLELDPGSAPAPLGDHIIQRARTHSQVEFDQLFEPLDTNGRRSVKTMLTQFDTAFADPGTPGRNLDRLAPTFRSVAPALRALRGQRTGDLGRVVTGTAGTMNALARSQARLAGLIDHAVVALGVTAARRAALGSFVQQAPSTLRDTRLTTARLRRTLDVLDPVAQRLRPGLRELAGASGAIRPALRQLSPLLKRARPLAVNLRTAMAALAPAARQGSTVMDRLDPTLNRTTDTLIPWLNARNDIGIRNYQAVGPTFSDLDSAAGQFTNLGHLMRFQGLAGGETSIGLPCATFFGDPKAPKRIQCDDFATVFGGLFGTHGTTSRGGR